MSDNVGRTSKLYLNTGTYSSITASELKKIGDVDVDMGKATNQQDTRETPNTKTIRGNNNIKLSFSYFKRKGATDAIFDALQASYWSNTNLDMFAMEADIATVGTKGIRGPFGVTVFNRKEPVNDSVRYEIELEEVCEYDSDTPLYAQPYEVTA